MSQPYYNLTPLGTPNSSTGVVQIGSTSGVYLHTISIGSSGTGTVTFYKTSSSSTGNEIIVLSGGGLGVPQTFVFDIEQTQIIRGQTTSTAEMVVTWA